jgi:soluble lytic murein transglycosylase-like protein
MKTDPRPPSRLPRYGALTALALVSSALVSTDLAGSPLTLPAGLESLWQTDPPMVAGIASSPSLPPPALASFSTPAFLEPAAYLRDLPFGDEIVAVAARYRLDALLVASVIEADSNFRADAVSPKGALGLMQVMPFHVEDGTEPFEPEVNLDIGSAYLATLLERFDGDLALALAGYHAGPGAVDRWNGIPPYSTTRRYVERVLALYDQHLVRLTIDPSV